MPKVKPSGLRKEYDCEQQSEEWIKVRMGIPTSSMFKSVMAKGEGKMRSEYMRKLAGEILTGVPMENYRGAAMDRGNAMEDELRNWYAFHHQEHELRRVGFITNGPKGCSPDSLVGKVGALEIKSQAPHILIDTLQNDHVPPEHKCQIQGTMWVAELEWVDLVIGYCGKPGYPGLPKFKKRILRDDAFIATLELEVSQFNRELAALVAQMRARG